MSLQHPGLQLSGELETATVASTCGTVATDTTTTGDLPFWYTFGASGQTEWFEILFRSMGDAVIAVDLHGHIVLANPAAEQLLGLDADELEGLHIGDTLRLFNRDTGEAVDNPLMEALQRNARMNLPDNTVLKNRDGVMVAVQDSAAPIRNAEGEVVGAVMVMTDVSALRAQHDELAYQALHDELTGLRNRRAFERDLAVAVSQAEDGQTHVLGCADLDQFKIVNDSAGHATGDQLLQQIADILRAELRSQDVIARLGGDEFGFILRDCPMDKAVERANRIRERVVEHRHIEGDKSYAVGISVGLVPLGKQVASVRDAMALADMACFAAKDAGRNRVEVCDPAREAVREQRQTIHRAASLHDALTHDRFRLWAQSIVRADGGGGPASFEMLVRLLEPGGQLVPPDAFIPAAERFGMVVSLDRWVIRHTLEALRQWLPDPRKRVSINLSGISLDDDALAEFIEEHLADNGIAPERITFEVTETAAINHFGKALKLIERLQAFGCEFYLDDFGAGLSSFSYLKRLPVNGIKIDKLFTTHLDTDDRDQELVSAFVRVAKALGMKTVIEGIESESVLRRARELEVDFVQGFYIGRPIPIWLGD